MMSKNLLNVLAFYVQIEDTLTAQISDNQIELVDTISGINLSFGVK